MTEALFLRSSNEFHSASYLVKMPLHHHVIVDAILLHVLQILLKLLFFTMCSVKEYLTIISHSEISVLL